ncbi:MAG: hypothetical protein ABIN37_11415 [Burkholderiaceae bacterium]
MSTLSHNLYPTFARPIPVRLPVMPYRWWAEFLALWQAQRTLRAHQRVLEGLNTAALRDIGMEAEMPITRHEAGIRLLNLVGPV